MSVALLHEVTEAGVRGDSDRVRALAGQALASLSPSGTLVDLAAEAEAENALHDLEARFDKFEVNLKHLDDETLVSQLEDDFALCVPAVADAAVPVENWAIPLLSALAGPFSGLLSFGLLVACKVALVALQAWAKKRLAGVARLSQGGKT